MGKIYKTIIPLILIAALGGCFARTSPPAPVSNKASNYYGTQPQNKMTRTQQVPAGGSITTSRRTTIRVKKGESLYKISRREKVPLRALIEANHLSPPYGLSAGTRLRIPAIRVYVVARGDTVYAIARRFGPNAPNASAHAIIRENGLKPPAYALEVNQKLILPWVQKRRANLKRKTITAQAFPKAAKHAKATNRTASKPRKKTRTRLRAPPPRSSRVFRWPLRGRILSRFGGKGGGLYNDGINIAARRGTPVHAVENGVVAYVGNELRGYGNLLLVRHSGGWVSAYAHNGKLLVKKGQVVSRGQAIARVGQSGTVSQPQLHFELRRGRRAVNPKRYLATRS